jgi:hypothetical protein
MIIERIQGNKRRKDRADQDADALTHPPRTSFLEYNAVMPPVYMASFQEQNASESAIGDCFHKKTVCTLAKSRE